MTNKEAIEILSNYHNGYFGYKIDCVQQAHNLAIKALEEKDQKQGSHESVGICKEYAFCKCSNCLKTMKFYLDSRNEFCCLADIRNKVKACIYCGAKLIKEAENDNTTGNHALGIFESRRIIGCETESD